MHRIHMKLAKNDVYSTSTTTEIPNMTMETNISFAPGFHISTFNPFNDQSSDVFFLVSVVAPLLFCCFAIFACALNSIWKTRSKLRALTQHAKEADAPDFTEFTIDLTTKVDSCIELSSPQISSKEESVLL